MGSNNGGTFNVPGSQPPQTIVVQNNFTPGTWGRLRNWFLYLMLTLFAVQMFTQADSEQSMQDEFHPLWT